MATSEDFVRLADPFRPELLVHCYRMLVRCTMQKTRCRRP